MYRFHSICFPSFRVFFLFFHTPCPWPVSPLFLIFFPFLFIYMFIPYFLIALFFFRKLFYFISYAQFYSFLYCSAPSLLFLFLRFNFFLPCISLFAFLSRDSFLYKRFHIPRSRVVFSFLLISFSFLILTLPFSFNLFSSFFENYVLTLFFMPIFYFYVTCSSLSFFPLLLSSFLSFFYLSFRPFSLPLRFSLYSLNWFFIFIIFVPFFFTFLVLIL